MTGSSWQPEQCPPRERAINEVGAEMGHKDVHLDAMLRHLGAAYSIRCTAGPRNQT